ncbi:MAG: hypothetical protein KAJ17_09230 [Candidatus Krumholzibacteria bacterium]|nr:hypothetical protein [Candidatus Krumholzibacteria bacterium]
MRDDYDIEDALKKSQLRPSPRVKKRLLSEFMRSHGAKHAQSVEPGFWKKPIPLYAVAASLIILVGLSFAAGQKTSRPESPPTASQELSQPQEITTAKDITWRIAERDLL